MMGISGSQLNDGSWHTVALELNRNSSSLTLDDRYTEGSRGPPFIHSLAAGVTIYFGALVRSRGGWGREFREANCRIASSDS